MPVCYRHGDRESHIRCQRCERSICPDCMHDAAVGFQCPECVARGRKETRSATTPYGGRRPARPVASVTLIVVNVVVWLAVVATGGRSSPLLFELVLIPRLAAEGSLWTLVTSAFAHVDVWHVALNMIAVYLLGPRLEVLLGRARFVTLYLISALSGSAMVMWASPQFQATLGASGAVFGLFAAYLVIALRVRANLQPILVVLAINLVFTVVGRGVISWQGHLGGFLGGLAVALVLVYAPRSRRSPWQWGGTAVVAALVLLAVLARMLLLT